VPLAPELTAALKQWKIQCPNGDLDLVFPAPTGLPTHRSNVLRRGLYPALRHAGLRCVKGLHSLRHSFASILIMQGTPITEVQHLLGHSNPQTTLKVYSHFLRDVNTNSVQLLARNLLGGPSVDTLGSPQTPAIAINDETPLISLGFLAPPAGFEPTAPGLGIL
jgi:integrase